MTIGRLQTDKPTNGVLPTRRACKVRENVPIRILVKQFPNGPLTLFKNMLTAVGTRLSENIITYHELAPSTKAEVEVVPYKKSEDILRRIE